MEVNDLEGRQDQWKVIFFNDGKSLSRSKEQDADGKEQLNGRGKWINR